MLMKTINDIVTLSDDKDLHEVVRKPFYCRIRPKKLKKPLLIEEETKRE